MEVSPKHTHSGPSTSSFSPEEIDFVEIMLVIWRSKWLALIAFMATFCLGFVFSFSQYPLGKSALETFRYSMAVQVVWGEQNLATVRWLVKNEFLPRALRDYQDNHPKEKKGLSINVDVPQNSNIIVLTGYGPASEKKAYLYVETRAIQLLIDEHKAAPNEDALSLILKPIKLQVIKESEAHKHPVSRGIIILISFFLAIFVALLAIFVVHLVGQVKERIRTL